MDRAVSELAAGGLGGFACVITGQPFDTIKVKLQTYPEQFKTPLQAFRKTWMQDGFLGMYAGCTPAVVSNIAENAVLFLCYGGCQRAVKWMTGVGSTEDLSVFQQACSGSLASVFSSIAITPPDRIKCILQAQSHSGRQSGARRYEVHKIIIEYRKSFNHSAKKINQSTTWRLNSSAKKASISAAP